MRALFLLLFTFVTFGLSAIQPATIKCVEVTAGGDAVITWEETTDVTDFVSYQLYFSNTPTGVYSLLTTINSASTSNYTHVGASADLNPCYYFIKTNGSSSTGFSDTLQSIQLVIGNPNDGTAKLEWNTPSSPLPSANSWYQIYKELPSGNWFILDSTETLSYVDNFSLCDVQVSYKIVMTGNGCVNQSATNAEQIKDLTPPATPILDSVSISPINGEVIIGWQPTLAPDTKGYIVYLQQGGVWNALDTIYGMANSIYQYPNPNATIAPPSYRIAALDSCLNASPLSIDEHSMILAYALNNCARSVSFSWNAYSHQPADVAKYEILMSIDGGAVQKIDEVVNLLNYNYSGLSHNSNYTFFVRAITPGNLTSSSTSISFLFKQTNLPTSIYFRYATVNDEHNVGLAVYVDTSAAVSNLLIYKLQRNKTYSLIATLPYSADGLYYAYDKNVETGFESYRYFARIIDSCGNEVMYSDTVKTILLVGTGNEDHTNTLTWSPYSQFAAPVESYAVYHSIGESTQFTYVGSSSSASLNYTEDVTPYRFEGGLFNYYVEAVEDSLNPYGFKDVSRSNVVTVDQKSLTFVPNAFAPAHENKIFKPSNIFIDSKNYNLMIYSRSGKRVFESRDPNQGWDGTLDGGEAPTGIYYYRISYQLGNGGGYEKEGWVFLAR